MGARNRVHLKVTTVFNERLLCAFKSPVSTSPPPRNLPTRWGLALASFLRGDTEAQVSELTCPRP